MKRRKAIALFLVMVLVLAATVAPMIIGQTQLGLVANNTQEGVSLFTFEIGASAPPIAIACGGCSGGGNGPD
jgi:hypothetical protein